MLRSLTLTARLRFATPIVLCIGLFLSLGAGPPSKPNASFNAQAELRDGIILTGVLKTRSFPLRLEYGTLEIEAHYLHSLNFRPPDSETAHDRLELIDGTIYRGKLSIAQIEIETAEGAKSIPCAEIRELRAPRPPAGAGFGALLIGLIALSVMEIVLGIDNIIFLAIVADKLPREQQPKARRLGLIAALGTRILLLCSLSFLLSLTKPLFTLPELPFLHELDAREISWRDLILFAGGLFLILKSVKEMHENLESQQKKETKEAAAKGRAGFIKVLIQITVLDIVFSLDSVITAVGMVQELGIMIAAMVIAMLVMVVFVGKVANFVTAHPTVKVLALSFLILIGVLLIAESLGQHIDKGYIYFAMAFAAGVEVINLRMLKRAVSGQLSAIG